MSRGNWTRITHDDRKKDDKTDGFTYHCANEHSWVVPFNELEVIIDAEADNNCPECG